MAPSFELASADHFVTSSDRSTIEVYELNSANPSIVRKFDWEKVAVIIVAAAAGRGQHQELHHQYDGLKVLNKEIKDQELKNLAADLTQSHLMVNPHGNCYLDVTSTSSFVDPTFGVEYYRVNDIFGWCRRYGVTPPPATVTSTTWSQHHDMMFGVPVVDYESQLKAKDDEIRGLDTEIDAKRAEVEAAAADMERCRKWNADLKSAHPSVPSGPGAIVKLQERRLSVLTATFLVSAASAAAARRPTPVVGLGFRVPEFDKGDVPFDGFNLVDQDCRGLPAPPAVRVRTRDGWFDTHNWWYVMSRSQKYLGGNAGRVLVFYDGDFSYAEVQNPRCNRREKVPVPYKMEGEFAADRNFDLVYSPLDEIRVGFTYRW
ncbi:unnamed protein product [Linum trigynum]|uniref:Uncharacterized protein n=1 Tax=Linum trigynum TaxID=586398 RepID=A0AAV2GSL3_9ROSI